MNEYDYERTARRLKIFKQISDLVYGKGMSSEGSVDLPRKLREQREQRSEQLETCSPARGIEPSGAAGRFEVLHDNVKKLQDQNQILSTAILALRDIIHQQQLEILQNAMNAGCFDGDTWHHGFMSDGEWLVIELGYDLKTHIPKDDLLRRIADRAKAFADISVENAMKSNNGKKD